MRKVIFCALIFMILPTAFAASEPEINIEKIDPQPVEPGETFTVHLVAQNDGTSPEEFDRLGVETGDKIEALGRTSMKDSFDLCGGCQKTGKFYFRVPENASTGSYPIEFHLTTEETGIVENAVVDVDGTPGLMTSVKNLEVKQGEDSAFTLEITNTGTGKATQTTLILENLEMSFNPSKTFLGTISPGETVEKEIMLKASEDIESGPSSINTELEFKDGSTRMTDNSSVSAFILKDAEVAISQLDVGKAYIGKETRVMIELENTGPGEAEGLSSQLSCKDSKIQNAKAFVGSLDSDESVPTVYHVTPRSSEVECTLKASYTDSGAENVERTFKISASRGKTDILPILGALALILVSGAYYWRKRENE